MRVAAHQLSLVILHTMEKDLRNTYALVLGHIARSTSFSLYY